jgi:hypothetical protein
MREYRYLTEGSAWRIRLDPDWPVGMGHRRWKDSPPAAGEAAVSIARFFRGRRCEWPHWAVGQAIRAGVTSWVRPQI